MARKRESFLALLTDVPWWVSVVIAAIVYAGMRWIAPSIEFNNLMLKSVASAMPQAAWAFGLLFLFPAVVSVFKRKQRQQLFDVQSGLDSIRALSWSDFELLIGEAFRRQGYVVEERGGGGPDGGVDLVLRKDGEKTIVQCKHWKAQQISVTVVRQLLGVMVAERANKGILVSSGRFTSEAKDFSRGKPIELLDGEAMRALVPAASGALNKVSPSSPGQTQASPGPCPNCGSKMVRRTAKKGTNAGSGFWGCSLYPKCRGIRTI